MRFGDIIEGSTWFKKPAGGRDDHIGTEPAALRVEPHRIQIPQMHSLELGHYVFA
jgi:hypothetical protein